MKIVGLQRVSLIDYPGRIAATVFLAGCNLDCGYCHNRWMLRPDDVQEAVSGDELIAWLETRLGLLDGVCVSGGEPTIHRELPDLLRRIKTLGLAVKLDTNGILPDRLEALLAEKLLDYVAMDFKAPLDARYSKMARVDVNVDNIRRSMRLLRESGIPYEFRTTVGPGLDERALRDMAHKVRPHERWVLQPFVASLGVDPEVACQEALREEDLRRIVADLQGITPGVKLRGDE